MAEQDMHGSTDRGEHQQDLGYTASANAVTFRAQSYHLQLSARLNLCVAQHSPFPTAAQFWHRCLLLRTLMWPVEQRGPVFCVRSTAERNSIFQGDDVRSANMETGDWGESRYSAAEVARTFWPHIICCDTSQDNVCTWSIWQGVRHRFTLCFCAVRRTFVRVKRQNKVIRQEVALQ